MSEQVADGAAVAGRRVGEFFEAHPRAGAFVAQGQDAAAKGVQSVGRGMRRVTEALPAGVSDWSGAAAGAMQRTVGRLSRAGLSPKRVVAHHQKKGHEVRILSDLRRLDLEQIDAVRGRALDWYYPATAAASGAGAGLLISGGELVVVASGGVAAAPSGAVVAGAFVGDATLVLGLASRVVGHIALLYGYDPEEPSERLFIMSVVNAGTAFSATAKTAALSDIARLTQALVRGKTWAVLDKSVLAQVSKRFADMISKRLTKQALGKVVPFAGIALGGAFNWVTLESITDAAGTAYRRRFLIEKYPHLADEVMSTASEGDELNNSDEPISVLDELREAGGPDLT